MANTVQILIEAIDKTGGVLGNISSYFDDLAKGINGLINNPFTDFIRESIDYTMEFHTQVEDLSRTTGITIEESSRLITAASGFGVSYQELMTGVETATKKGREITVEELGKIADEYVAIGASDGPIGQAKYLVDIFGQSGLDMAALFAEGASGVETAMSDVSDAVAIDGSEQTKFDAYETSLGNFKETLGGFKIAVAGEFLPALTEMFDGLNNLMGKYDEVNAKFRIVHFNIATMGGLLLGLHDNMKNFVMPEIKFAEDLSTYEAYRNYMQQIFDIAGLVVDGYGTIRTKTGEVIEGVLVLTEAEWNAKEAADAVKSTIDATTGKTIIITVDAHFTKAAREAIGIMGGGISGTGINQGKVIYEERAVGGSVAPNVPYLVGENGPEIFKPNAAGSIIPNGQISDYSGGGEVDYDRMARAFIEALERSSLVR